MTSLENRRRWFALALIVAAQFGGAIGLAVATTIATTFTNRYVDAHVGTSPLGGAALTHGFQVTFYVLAAIAGLGAVAAAVLIESHPSVSDAAEIEGERLREAA
jgi:MFS family permease